MQGHMSKYEMTLNYCFFLTLFQTLVYWVETKLGEVEK
jgi:hypothetical protein